MTVSSNYLGHIVLIQAPRQHPAMVHTISTQILGTETKIHSDSKCPLRLSYSGQIHSRPDQKTEPNGQAKRKKSLNNKKGQAYVAGHVALARLCRSPA